MERCKLIKRAYYIKTAPEAIKAFSSGAGYLETSSIEPRLRYLVQLRVSQINGCAYCVDLHTNQLRREEETEQRIDCLVVWKEVPFYDVRERAALEWAEVVTLIKDTHAPDSAYEAVSAQFSENYLITRFSEFRTHRFNWVFYENSESVVGLDLRCCA